MAEQILHRVKYRRGVRLDRDPVLRPQHVEIERGHQRRDRGARRLMAADLEPVAVGPQMVGVVDHPGRQPQHLALERAEAGELVGGLSTRLRPRIAGQGPQHRSTPARAISLSDMLLENLRPLARGLTQPRAMLK